MEEHPQNSRRKKRRLVVFIVQSLQPSGRTSTVLSLLDGLSRVYECECWVLAIPPNGEQAIRIFPHPGGLSPRLFGNIAAAMREARPLLVHTHGTLADSYGIPAARLAGVPAVISTLHRGDKSQESSLSQRVRNKIAYSLADRIAVVSNDQMHHMIRSYGMGPRRWKLIPLGIDLERFTSLPLWSGFSNQPRVILSTGHLRRERNHEVLLRAFARVAHQFADTELWLAGKPEENRLAELSAEAQRLGIASRTRFLGFRKDIGTLLGQAYMCIHSAHFEALGCSLIEYSAAARPVVATRVGGVSAVIRHGETGFLCQPGDDVEFAGRMAQLLDNTQMAKEMGIAGREWATSHFSHQQMISCYLDLYSELLHTGAT